MAKNAYDLFTLIIKPIKNVKNTYSHQIFSSLFWTNSTENLQACIQHQF